MEVTPNDEARWWAKVDRRGPDECWPWVASSWRGGYGQFKIGGHPIGAHRVSFLIHVGPIPDGLDVLHHCDHSWCVNPRCLYLGTDIENAYDRTSRRRYRGGRPRRSAWATRYSACRECGRTDRPHSARGLCWTCYARAPRPTLIGDNHGGGRAGRPVGAWSMRYGACRECGTTEIPPKGRGLCRRCYGRLYIRQQRAGRTS
jgi:hypothetical protein